MSAGLAVFPAELDPAGWERKKGAFAPGDEMPDKLKALKRKHGAIDWKLFAPDWARSARSPEELDQALALRERTWKGTVAPLRRDVAEVATLAQKLAREKSAAKVTVDAAKAIAAAATTLGDALDEAGAALKTTHQSASKALAVALAAQDEAEPAGALLDPAVLLKQLTLCRRDPERRVSFAFVDGQDKAPGTLALHPRLTGRKMFSTLQSETGSRTGAHGTAWITEGTLVLQVDKPMSGLVKKLRAALRACGFRIPRIAVWDAAGAVAEQDLSDEADEAMPGAPGSTGTAAPQRPAPPGGPAKPAGNGATASAAATPSASATPAKPTANPATPRPGRRVSPRIAFMQTRLAWDQTRREIQAELRRLEEQVLDACRDDPDIEEIRANTGVLYSVLDHLDERLIDKLDDALNATEDEARRRFHDEALAIVEQYQAFARTDDLLAAIAHNGFVELEVPRVLDERLGAMARQLEQAIQA